MLVAAMTAMGVLYIGKPFGTRLDYLSALLRGVGADQGIKGFGGVLNKIGVPTALGTAGTAPKAS